MVFRARCCNPIRGEKIVGYITRGKGVSVHSATCPNVVNLMFDPERRIDVEWDKAGATAARYTVRLTIERRGSEGTCSPTSAPASPTSTRTSRTSKPHVGDDHRRHRMTVEISDLKHLERVIKSLKSVEGVLAVDRASR